MGRRDSDLHRAAWGIDQRKFSREKECDRQSPSLGYTKERRSASLSKQHRTKKIGIQIKQKCEIIQKIEDTKIKDKCQQIVKIKKTDPGVKQYMQNKKKQILTNIHKMKKQTIIKKERIRSNLKKLNDFIQRSRSKSSEKKAKKKSLSPNRVASPDDFYQKYERLYNELESQRKK